MSALRGLLRRFAITGSAALLVMGATTFVRAGILESVPIQAYAGDPRLNPGRADVRATDETVAHAGYHPTVAVLADLGVAYSEGDLAGRIREQTTLPGAAGITVNQTLFNRFQTDNDTWQAESTVYSERETLRFIELITLFNAAQAYMDVLRDTANLQRQRNTVEELEEQLRQTRDRFNVGEISRTDVNLAEMRLAGAPLAGRASEAQLRFSVGTYRHIIGVERRQLVSSWLLDRYVPASLNTSIEITLKQHFSIVAQMYAVDAAEARVIASQAQGPVPQDGTQRCARGGPRVPAHRPSTS